MADRVHESRCPSVIDMHSAADGRLARIRLPGGRVTPAQLRAVGAAAGEGSGVVEITRRANLQVRGLPDTSGPAVAAMLSAVGLIPSQTHERLRNIVAAPWGGRHPDALAATDEIVADLDAGLCADDALAALPDRFLFGVDDGSGTLPDVGNDIGVIAEFAREDEDGMRFRLAIAGVPTSATATPRDAATLALDGARAFLRARRRGDRPRAWRAGELSAGAASVAAEMPGVAVLPRPEALRRPIRPGVQGQRDGLASVTALAPLGRVDGAMLLALADLLDASGLGDLRLSPERTVTLVDVPPLRAAHLLDSLGDLGFVVVPGSGWEGLTACAGTGACGKATADVRAAIHERVALRDGSSPAEHWSACPRGCGEPGDATITVVATDAGLDVRVGDVRAEVADTTEALALLTSMSPS